MLCQACRSIDVSNAGIATSPLVGSSDIPRILVDRFNLRAKKPTQLGSVQNVIDRASICDFCAFINSNYDLRSEDPESTCEAVEDWQCQFEVNTSTGLERQQIRGMLVQLQPHQNEEIFEGPYLPLALSSEG